MVSEETAKNIDVNALREMAKNAKPADGAAGASGGGFGANSKDEWADYDMNANIKDEDK